MIPETIPPPPERQIITCALCDKAGRRSKVISIHTTFVHDGMLYNHVPIMVCLNRKCLLERGAGTVIEHRVPKRANTSAY